MIEIKLPDDFDAETYLRLNEDVRRAGMDAKRHYLKHGYAERRPWKEEAPHFEREFNTLVADLKTMHPHAEAMSLAVGGLFETMGQSQVDVLEQCSGLRDGIAIADLGCGSGRTASHIAMRFPNCTYTGIDVVQDLLDYAKSVCPPTYRFIRNTQLSFPLPDASCDLVLALSVFTHLLHDESYAYLQDAIRVLRPGGYIAFSFLEFSRPFHWNVFADTLKGRKAGTVGHMNTFIERSSIEIWSHHLELKLVGFFEIGQTLAVLQKP